MALLGAAEAKSRSAVQKISFALRHIELGKRLVLQGGGGGSVRGRE